MVVNIDNRKLGFKDNGLLDHQLGDWLPVQQAQITGRSDLRIMSVRFRIFLDTSKTKSCKAKSCQAGYLQKFSSVTFHCFGGGIQCLFHCSTSAVKYKLKLFRKHQLHLTSMDFGTKDRKSTRL